MRALAFELERPGYLCTGLSEYYGLGCWGYGFELDVASEC